MFDEYVSQLFLDNCCHRNWRYNYFRYLYRDGYGDGKEKAETEKPENMKSQPHYMEQQHQQQNQAFVDETADLSAAAAGRRNASETSEDERTEGTDVVKQKEEVKIVIGDQVGFDVLYLTQLCAMFFD